MNTGRTRHSGEAVNHETHETHEHERKRAENTISTSLLFLLFFVCFVCFVVEFLLSLRFGGAFGAQGADHRAGFPHFAVRYFFQFFF